MKLRVLVLIFILLIGVAFADTVPSSVTPPITQPQNIMFENCSKMFAVNSEKLFYLTLAGVAANRFTIDEIQSNNGYVVFSAVNNKYLATVAGIDSSNSILRITPLSNIYYFPPGILINMFRYIDLNINAEVK